MNPREYETEVLEGNYLLFKYLSSPRVSTIGRFGSVESNLLASIVEKNVTIKNRWQGWVNAGISFPTNSVLNQFSKFYTDSILELDCLAAWPMEVLPSQKPLINEHLPKSSFIIPLRCLDPVQMVVDGLSSTEVWTCALRGKNVLVIHSFSDLIHSQYSKNLSLHVKRILPEFNLYTIRPPITNGLTFWKGSYTANLNNFNVLIEKFISEHKIDVALIAAGSYGLPITCTLKKLGVSSIYMGGSLQVLFGILGNRWRGIEGLQAAITDSWVKSPKENRPLGYKLIERGTYW